MQIFVSHGVEDEPQVTSLVDRLKESLPNCSFFVSSAGGIQPGEEWWKSVADHLRNSVTALIVLSPRSLDRPWVLFESGAAWALNKQPIPVLLDGLSASAVSGPLTILQTVSADDNLDDLIARLAKLTGIPRSAPHAPAPEPDRGTPGQVYLPGVYDGEHRRIPLGGWERYKGSGDVPVVKNYFDTGSSYNDGYRFPPQEDTLNATGGALGIRLMPFQDVHFYAVCTLTGGRQIKVYASTIHATWGFSGAQKDEFRVPLPVLSQRKWHIFVVRLNTFSAAFGGHVKSIDGFRVRGGIRLSHIWCMPATWHVAPVAKRDVITEILWPG